MSDTTNYERRRKRALVAVLSALLIAFCLVTLTAGATVAQNNNTTDFYDSWDNVSVDNESWMEGNENATLDNTTTMFTKVQTFVIGSNGDGSTPVLFTGVLFVGVILGVTASSGVGLLAGGVLTVGALFGAQGVGIAPGWLYPLAMMGIGIVLASIAKRVLR